MKWKSLLPLSAGVLLLTIVGCRSPLEALIRGQNPSPRMPDARPVQPAVYSSGAIVYGDGHQVIQNCPGGPAACGWGNAAPATRSSGNRGWNRGNTGRHDHRWDYVPPHGLRYPQRNLPSGIVFYPYYTLKGPDDFFLQ